MTDFQEQLRNQNQKRNDKKCKNLSCLPHKIILISAQDLKHGNLKQKNPHEFSVWLFERVTNNTFQKNWF